MERHMQRRAFTLIELLLVMVILVVLAGVAVPVYFNQRSKVNVNATKATISNVKTALGQFEVELGRFPTSEEGLQALVTNPGIDGWHQYMESLPTDGWGRTFAYVCPGTKHPDSYDLWSFGANGTDDNGDPSSDDITQDTK